MKKYLAIIPARGGSKGIPGKNIIDVAGRPLIAYSIEVAKLMTENNIAAKAIVSTDSEEIADISKKLGIDVPFLRPAELSGDKAKSIDFLLHALKFYEEQGEEFDAIILLQPTSPLRTYEDIKEAVEIYESSGAQSLISVYQEDYICDLVSYHKDGDFGVPLDDRHNKGVRRQEHNKLFIRNGAIYISDTGLLQKENLIISDKPALYVMPKSKSVNLDTTEDLELLRWILK